MAGSETVGGAAADFAGTAYITNAQWVSLTVQGLLDCDFGYPLQPSELVVERDLELSTRFTYSRGSNFSAYGWKSAPQEVDLGGH